MRWLRAGVISQPPSVAQRERQLLHGERDAVGPVSDGGGQATLGLCPEQRGQHRPDGSGVEWLQADLGQLLPPPQLGPDRPEPAVAGQLVVPIASNKQHRFPAGGVGQRGQQVECGLIRPLQVIDEDHGQHASLSRPGAGQPVAGQPGASRPGVSQHSARRNGVSQHGAHGAGHCRKADIGRRRPQLRQDHREYAIGRAGRPGQCRADYLGDRLVCRRVPFHRPAPAAPEPATPPPAAPAPAAPDPASPAPAVPDPAAPDPASPAPAVPDPADPDPADPDPAAPDPASPASAVPEPADPDPASPASAAPEPAAPAPAAPTLASTCSTSAVLPTPASPATKTTGAWPVRAVRRKPRSSATSASRPTSNPPMSPACTM